MVTKFDQLWSLLQLRFYCAMHYSAKHSIEIACCPFVGLSVHLSICDIGSSGPHMLEILETNYTDN